MAFIFNIGAFFTPVYSHAMNDPQAWIGIGFALVVTVAAILSIICVFFYNNRPDQVNWVKRAMLVQTIGIGWGVGILISLGGFGLFLWDEVLGVLLLAGALTAQIFALRGIRKDEELVRSMDRIR